MGTPHPQKNTTLMMHLIDERHLGIRDRKESYSDFTYNPFLSFARQITL